MCLGGARGKGIRDRGQRSGRNFEKKYFKSIRFKSARLRVVTDKGEKKTAAGMRLVE